MIQAFEIHPNRTASIRYRDVTADELFEVARLVVSAEIAEDPHDRMDDAAALQRAAVRGNERKLGRRSRPGQTGSFVMSSPTSSKGCANPRKRARPTTSIRLSRAPSASSASAARKTAGASRTPTIVNGGVNHFGSPFNFPEEFISVYRLHPMLPDLIDTARWRTRTTIRSRIPVVDNVPRPGHELHA